MGPVPVKANRSDAVIQSLYTAGSAHTPSHCPRSFRLSFFFPAIFPSMCIVCNSFKLRNTKFLENAFDALVLESKLCSAGNTATGRARGTAGVSRTGHSFIRNPRRGPRPPVAEKLIRRPQHWPLAGAEETRPSDVDLPATGCIRSLLARRTRSQTHNGCSPPAVALKE